MSVETWKRMTTAQLIASLASGLALLSSANISGAVPSPSTYERMAEWTIESHKAYPDPFNDVDVDVIFERNQHRWRVPTFWRGDNRWTVRFAPPAPGAYRFHLESTDKTNPELNGQPSQVTITAYTGRNPLLSHGALRVSASK